MKNNNRNRIRLRWYNEGITRYNWGDRLNPELVSLLSGADVEDWQEPSAFNKLLHRAYYKLTKKSLLLPRMPWQTPTHLVIGSGLARANNNTIVWGQGFGYADEQLAQPPLKICAVRGPLSRDRLLEGGFDCPDVLGDPAILYPLFDRPIVEIDTDVGIIHHLDDRNYASPKLGEAITAKYIDITLPLERFVDELLSCRKILSSSLHGLIAAHAYGVPAGWIQFAERSRIDGFKFNDYWTSVGYPDMAATEVSAGAFAPELADIPVESINGPDALDLLKACPFLPSDRLEALASRCEGVYQRPRGVEQAVSS